MIARDCILHTISSASSSSSPQVTVVIQGPYHKSFTRTCIEEWLSRNDNIVIIVSTTTVIRFEELSPYEKARVQEGLLVFIIAKPPDPIRWPDFWRTNHSNQNLQRLTSFVGLRHAYLELKSKFSIKVRSDTFLGRKHVLRHMINEVEEDFPLAKEDAQTSGMRGRLAVTGHCTISDESALPNAPFHIRDHFYFGYTEDVLSFFEMRTSWNNGAGIGISAPESAMTVLWMKDHNIKAATTIELLSRFFIIENASFVEQVRLLPKGTWFMNYTRYLREGESYVAEVYAAMDPPQLITTREKWIASKEQLKINPTIGPLQFFD